MTETPKRFECYLNIQNTNGVKGDAVIISGTAETMKEAQTLFDHALKSHKEMEK